MIKKLFIPLIILMLLPAALLSAWDWGLLLDQNASVEYTGDTEITYSGTLIPWFSSPAGKSGKFYLSAGMEAEYERKDFAPVPQLLRTEFSWSFGQGSVFKAGRLYYSDPLGLIVNGLFDGASYSFNAGSRGSLDLGLCYSGFVYKKTTEITMTGEEWQSYYTTLDYSNFADTYFAPRRLIAKADWDPGLTEDLRLKMSLIGQFDLNGRDYTYHSQYLSAKAILPKNDLIFTFGLCVETAEINYANENLFRLGMAGEFGVTWMPPSALTDQLSFTGRFSSGKAGDTFTAFVPITTAAQGDVLRTKLSGISMLRFDYTAKPVDNFSFTLASSYFILSDLGTYIGFPAEKDGHFLGNEFSGYLTWTPYSDLRLNFGGGVFLPALGNADSKSDPMWRIELSAILVFF